MLLTQEVLWNEEIEGPESAGRQLTKIVSEAAKKSSRTEN
jgi:hypothetical protein